MPETASQEPRLQRVESAVTELTGSLARVESEMGHFGQLLSTGLQSLGAKMDLSSAQNVQIETKINGLIPRIERLEAEAQKKSDNRKSIKNAFVGLTLVGLGAVISQWGSTLAQFVIAMLGS